MVPHNGDGPSDPDSDTPPSNEAIEKALRDSVSAIFKSGNLDELTVRRVRADAEKRLGLDDGFLRADDLWKGKSSLVIKDEVVCLINQINSSS